MPEYTIHNLSTDADPNTQVSLAELPPERREYLRRYALRYTAGIISTYEESSDFEEEVELHDNQPDDGILHTERDALGTALRMLIEDLQQQAHQPAKGAKA